MPPSRHFELLIELNEKQAPITLDIMSPQGHGKVLLGSTAELSMDVSVLK
jgi:hypothetical protein